MLNIEVQYTIDGYGKLLPSKEFYVYNGTDGRIYNSLVDYKKGMRNQFQVYSFERGDIFSFKSGADLNSGNSVKTGDTLGIIISNKNFQDLVDYENQLNEYKSFLNFSASGMKETDIEVLQKEIEYAKLQFSEHSKLLKRYKALAEKDLITKEEYEIEEGRNRLYKLSIDIAESKLETAETGVKPEELKYIRDQINSAQRSVDFLIGKISELNITSPIDGLVDRSLGGDTLMSVYDVSEFVLLIPVKLNQRKFIYRDQMVKFGHPISDTLVQASIIDINSTIEKINETAVILVFADSIENTKGLYPGMIINTKIFCENVNLLKYIFLYIS